MSFYRGTLEKELALGMVANNLTSDKISTSNAKMIKLKLMLTKENPKPLIVLQSVTFVNTVLSNHCYVFKLSLKRQFAKEHLYVFPLLAQTDVTQPARDVPGTSPEGPLKVLTSGTSRGLLEDQHKN